MVVKKKKKEDLQRPPSPQKITDASKYNPETAKFKKVSPSVRGDIERLKMNAQGKLSAAQAVEQKETQKQENLSQTQEIFNIGEDLKLSPEEIQLNNKEKDNRGFFETIGDYASPIPTDKEGFAIDRKTGQRILNEEGQEMKIKTGVAPIGSQASAIKGLGFLKGKIFGNAQQAVRAGNTAKSAKLLKPSIDALQTFGLVILGAKSFGGFNINSEVDEAQQALNTMGQVTSTIVGESTSGAGDWRAGLEELRRTENTILELEQRIKSGEIRSATLKFNGKILDINADIQDQLLTIREGIADIRTFALQGQFPDMSEQEIQVYLEQLEKDGLIKRESYESTRR